MSVLRVTRRVHWSSLGVEEEDHGLGDVKKEAWQETVLL